MKFLIATGLSAALLAAAAQPAAAAEPNPKDVECLMVTFMMADSKDEQNRMAATIGAFYFLGKLDGASPGASLDGPLVALIKSIKPADAEAMGKRCGEELQARGGQIAGLGERIGKAVGEAAPATAAPAPATPAPK